MYILPVRSPAAPSRSELLSPKAGSARAGASREVRRPFLLQPRWEGGGREAASRAPALKLGGLCRRLLSNRWEGGGDGGRLRRCRSAFREPGGGSHGCMAKRGPAPGRGRLSLQSVKRAVPSGHSWSDLSGRLLDLGIRCLLAAAGTEAPGSTGLRQKADCSFCP